MDPTTASQEILQITQNDLRAVDTIGWTRSSTKLPEPDRYLGTLIFASIGAIAIVKRNRVAAKAIDSTPPLE